MRDEIANELGALKLMKGESMYSAGNEKRVNYPVEYM
jgi:hypothetical protein